MRRVTICPMEAAWPGYFPPSWPGPKFAPGPVGPGVWDWPPDPDPPPESAPVDVDPDEEEEAVELVAGAVGVSGGE